jgi:hypothetical protein
MTAEPAASGDGGRADAIRDLLALVRARHEGDLDATLAILGCVGEHELRVLAGVFAETHCNLLIRYVAALRLIKDEQECEFVRLADVEALNDIPGSRAYLTRLIAAWQASDARGTTA